MTTEKLGTVVNVKYFKYKSSFDLPFSNITDIIVECDGKVVAHVYPDLVNRREDVACVVATVVKGVADHFGNSFKVKVTEENLKDVGETLGLQEISV
jgi:hypothetical protein